MHALREILRFTLRILRYTGQFLLSLLRLYRLAWRIRRNTAAWPDLPGQTAAVGGV